MYIYHYSPVDKPKLKVDPKYFGKNLYTKGDTTALGINRSFWYTTPHDAEDFVIHNNLYRAEIPASKIYPLNKDPKHLDKEEYTLYEYVRAVLDAGYEGILYGDTEEMSYKVVNMMVPVNAVQVTNPYKKKELEEWLARTPKIGKLVTIKNILTKLVG